MWKSFVLTSGILGVLMGMTGPPACAAEDEAARGDEMRPQVQPLIRGALWWIQPQVVDWSDEQLEKAIQAQRDVGFDLLWLLNAAGVLAQDGGADLLERIYSLADQKNMKVIIDLPQGGWYRKASAEDLIALVTEAVRDLHGRYGHHSSFHAWYLNYEINPIRPGDTEETAFWRHVWKSIAAECHRVAPGSLVTISPFFLLDDTSRRGFIYLTPQQYADWWGATLKETGIDVIMLQDSGEHLAFFTLEQREPYWAATARAAREAGAQFWLNVEDEKVINYLKYFTFLEREEIEELAAKVASQPEAREAQRRLAEEMTRTVHGPDELTRAQQASAVLFGGDLEGLDARDIADIFADVPSSELRGSALQDGGVPVVDLVAESGLATSRGQARRDVQGGGIYLNNRRVDDPAQAATLADAIDGQFLVLRKGKKRYHLVRVVR